MSQPRNCEKCRSFFTTGDSNKVLCSKCLKTDWIDLHIDNIPKDFRDNDNYEIEFKSVNSWQKENSDRKEILHLIIDDEYKYRYRIQEKKPIQCDRCNGLGSVVLCYDRFSHSSVICGKCSGRGIHE